MIDGCKEECKDVGFNDYFQKPIKKDKLETLINNYKSIRMEDQGVVIIVQRRQQQT
jgi:two-component SAPR family response regulator